METSELSCNSATLKRRLHVRCSYSGIGIISVLKFVARI
jgi:hypothetical protein